MKYRGFLIFYHQDMDLYGVYRLGKLTNPRNALALFNNADRAKAYIDKEVSNA